MEKTLCQFGPVLFDELEQVAARRGGCPSLAWLRDDHPSLGEIRDALGRIRGGQEEDPGRAVTKAALKVRDYVGGVQAAVRSVQDLGRIVRARGEAAIQVTRLAAELTRQVEGPLIDRLDEAWAALAPTGLPEVLVKAHHDYLNVLRAHRESDAIERRLDGDLSGDNVDGPFLRLEEAWKQYLNDTGPKDAGARQGYGDALQAMRVAVTRAEVAEVKYRFACNVKRKARQAQRVAARASSIAAGSWKMVTDVLSPSPPHPPGRNGRAHVGPNGAPGGEAGDEPKIEEARGDVARAMAEPLPVMPDARKKPSRPEDDLEEALADVRKSLNRAILAYRVLIKSRQDARVLTDESRGLVEPKEPKPGLWDRLLGRVGLQRSRINDYPNALFAMDDMVTDVARKTALDLNTVGLAFSGGGIRSATFNLGVLQGLASLGLLKRIDYLSTVSGGGYIGSWLAAWLRREGGAAGDPENVASVEGKAELAGKRTRTARALENVEAQLCSNRWAQRTALRRWITAEEVATGVEGRGRPLNRVVDEEPEPIYHLRQFSNYLTPKVGLASADTWTVISIYLRNLMLNQFILLPLILSLVLVPRLMLILFGLDLSRFPILHQAMEEEAAILMVALGAMSFGMTYWVIGNIRASRGRVTQGSDRAYDPTLPYVSCFILLPLVLASLCFTVLFSHQVGDGALGPRYFPSSLILWPWTIGADKSTVPKYFAGWMYTTAAAFGAFVGLVRFLTSLVIELSSRLWKESEVGGGVRASLGSLPRHLGNSIGRSFAAFVSAFFSAGGLYLVLALIRRAVGEDHALLAPLFATIGVPLLILTAGIGSSIEVGLIGGYEEEDMREWRASLGAYFLMIAAVWVFFFGLSLYGPLLIRAVGLAFTAAIAAGWISLSTLGVLAGQSAKTGPEQGRRPLDYVALVAPAVFLTGLLVAVACLACAVQGVRIPLYSDMTLPADPASVTVTKKYLDDLVNAAYSPRTGLWLLACALLAAYNCFKIDVNLFSMNLFYANRLVRCYLGASRPRPASGEGRPNVAPSNCPVPARRPNPLTGFDPADDFPIKDLAIVRTWGGDDLVTDYRGPYHLINSAMNLVSGSELAWQERMAESFLLSPLYCGCQTTGYRKSVVIQDEVPRDSKDPDYRADDEHPERGLIKGYGGDLRLGTAVSISGAAASPNMGYHSSPLVTILLTVFNARLGMWLPNPARRGWRKVGPGFASYLIDELTGRTTDKGKYVYLSDGGHFENLGVYELIRRRCRFVVVCDAGADPTSAFWDLGSLVRKCREDFGVRVEIDIAPLLKTEATGRSQRHCAVGKIRYDDVDASATPGILFYIKPTLTGDESSDIRNYVVEHNDFPHEPTSDQFFSESQFESYRQLGEHIAARVFGEAVRETAGATQAETIFRRLKRKWFHPLPGANHRFLESVEPFIKIHDAFRNDPRLGRLSRQLYPEVDGDGTTTDSTVRAEIHAVCQMLQAMEIAWLKANLDEFTDHPMNRGWMNVFRRWTTSRAFQDYWPALRGEFSEGFVQFCEDELNLSAAAVETRRIDPATLDEFQAAVGELDEEFLLEWPSVSWLGQLPRSVAPSEMLRHAASPDGKATGLSQPAAWLIGTFPPGSSSAKPSRCYGLILGWKVDPDVIGLLIWLRGAYRTLRIGRAAIDHALGQIYQERRKNGRIGFSIRVGYPGTDAAGGRDQWQGSVWQNFFLAEGFHRSDPDIETPGVSVMERRFDQ